MNLTTLYRVSNPHFDCSLLRFPKKSNFLTAIEFNITVRKAAIILALSGLLSLVCGAGQVSSASAPTFNVQNLSAPLNVALVSDAVEQAEQVCAATAEDTITIIYHSDSMTPNGLADLLASVSAAHHGTRIGHLGIVAHGGPGELFLGKGNILSLATLPGHALALERLRSVLASDARLDLYACSVAAGRGGKTFVDELAALTGAAVFASDNPVGTMPGADFVWEYHAGQVNASMELLLVREMEKIPQLCLAPQPFGTSLGSFNGVTTYSNGSGTYDSGIHNNDTGIFTGLKWQCVEYVQRYYYLQYGMNLYTLSGGINAYQFFGAASTMDLTAYANGSTTPPQAGDILCFSGGNGHVAIVRGTSFNERGQNELDLDIIEQNGTNDISDAWFPLTYTVSGGVYNVSAAHLSASLSVQGWLRKVATNQRPSIPSITTPTSPKIGNVTISYTLADPESDSCGIAVWYSPDGGSNWNTATAGSGGDGTVPLTSSPGGTAHTFVWASGSDIVNTSNPNVRFRITPVDTGGAGTAGTTGTFTIQNSVVAPTVTITFPTSNPTYSTISGTVNLGGTASDNVGVSQVTWSNNRGGSGTASGTTSWSVNGISLQTGQNVITITAHDAAGSTGSDTLTVTYTPGSGPIISPSLTDFPLSLQQGGSGSASFMVSNSGTDILNFNVTASATPMWLNLLTTSGRSISNQVPVGFQYPVGSLAVGHYSATITITGNASNSPQIVNVTLDVTPPPISVTVQTSPSGLPITVDGTACTAPQTFSWLSGSGHTIATTSQSGGTGIQYAWSNWSDGGAVSHIVTPTVGTTYTANFNTQYYLTMSMGTGGNSVSPGRGWYTSGQIVSIGATPYGGYSFSSWSGSGSGSYSGGSNSTSVTMNGPITETANFTGIVSTVTFNSQGGTTPNPATLNVTYGSTYGTLATTSRTGYTFGGWWTGINGTGTQVTAATIITITEAQTLYAKWTTALQTWLTTHGFAASTNLLSTPSNDGVSLLMAYALNLDPTQNQSANLPRPVCAGNQLSLTFYAGNADVTYTVQSSTDLQSWSATGVTISAPDANNNRMATVPMVGGSRFLRLVVSH
jgi:uncharacterized repeat protein (TIGR02543 family)